jgi:predicted dehydrogenase
MRRAPLRVAVIGCGAIGRKRAEALGADRLVGCFDLDVRARESLAVDFGSQACGSAEALLALEPDVVVVATVHSALADQACAALAAGAHVLVEKPAGTGSAQVSRIRSAATGAGRMVKVGFNHRFHPGIERALAEARSGDHGEVMFLRARYGHGGRLGYEQEWRCDPAVSGGGEIVDQGMHLLDLSYALLGPLPVHASLLRTHFWEAPVDDNALIVLGEPGGVGSAAPWAVLHATWTEWKNLFSLEIYCRHAKLAVDGLARSYGRQELRIHRMRPELGPPDTEVVQYPERDTSWEREWDHFTAAIAAGDGSAPLAGDLASAHYAWTAVEQAQAAAGGPA